MKQLALFEQAPLLSPEQQRRPRPRKRKPGLKRTFCEHCSRYGFFETPGACVSARSKIGR